MKTKILSLTLVTLLSASFAMAQKQETTSTTSASQTKDNNGSKGVFVGLVYSNLTDENIKGEFTTTRNGSEIYNSSSDYKGGMHVGLYGLNVGYKNNYAFGPLGFNAGFSFLKGLNASEIESKVNLYKVYGDIAWEATEHIVLSGGLNLSYFDNITNYNNFKYDPALGADLGIEAKFKEFSVLVGYQVLGLSGHGTEYDYSSSYGDTYKYDSKITGSISGIITQVSYTF